jgi:RNA polymerase sigma factor (sigma-70 family)
MSPVSDLSEKAKRDYELVTLAIGGDQRAFAKLMELYRDTLFSVIKKMVNNDDDAEDLTIESFAKAFKMLNNYVPKYAFSTWLFKIATNHGIDFLRKQNKIKTLSISTSAENADLSSYDYLRAEMMDPEEKMIGEQSETIILEFIKKLHPDYQQILNLKYFHGFSYIEISEELKIPLGTVKARLFRSKELLLSTFKNGEIA